MAVDLRTRVEAFGIGWWLALAVVFIAVIMGFMNLLLKEAALLIVAVCAVRL